MPQFVSKYGEWKARKEKTYLGPEAPDGKEIYIGEDRAAREMLDANGGQLGTHFRTNMDLVFRAKNLGFGSVQEYLDFTGYNEKQEGERFDDILKEVVNHDALVKRKPGARIERSGGDDTSGHGQHKKGGFGKPKELGGGE